MTYNETILWQRFMQDKGVLNNFEYLYRAHRFDKRSLEQYLEETEAEDVILNGFDFSGARNTIFDFKYWKALNEKWQRRLREFRDTGKMEEEAQILCAHCKRVLPKSAFEYTTKGILHKHCKECESGEWDRRRKEQEKAAKELENKQKEVRELEKAIADKQWSLSVKQAALAKIKGEIQPEQPAATVEPEAHVSRPVTPDKLTAPKLGEYDATLHFKKGQKSITFNAVLSAQLQKGQFTKCFLNADRQHRMFLLFNRVDGSNVTGVSSRASMLLGVNSVEICRTLAARFNLEEGDNYYLHITRNLSKTSNYLTVEVLKVRSREEYIKIAQQREEGTEDEEPTPVVEEQQQEPEPVKSEPLIDFDVPDEAQAPEPATKPSTAVRLLEEMINRGMATERDMATFLYQRGWRLQEPVTAYKKFSL